MAAFAGDPEPPGAGSTPGHGRRSGAIHPSLEPQREIAPLCRLYQIGPAGIDRPARLFLVPCKSDDDACGVQHTGRLKCLEGVEENHVPALHVLHSRTRRHVSVSFEALEGAVLLEHRVQMSDQQQPPPGSAVDFGEQVTRPVHVGRHVYPARLEPQPGQLGIEDPADLSDARVIHGAAVHVDNALEQGDRLVRVFVDVPDDRFLGACQRLGDRRRCSAWSGEREYHRCQRRRAAEAGKECDS
jgi:hypothetical protein